MSYLASSWAMCGSCDYHRQVFVKLNSYKYYLLHNKIFKAMHITGWKGRQEGTPLWKIPYSELYADLLQSKVPCVVSACIGSQDVPEISGVAKGSVFNQELIQTIEKFGWDAFGEEGEFHTLVQVWLVPTHQALGFE